MSDWHGLIFYKKDKMSGTPDPISLMSSITRTSDPRLITDTISYDLSPVNCTFTSLPFYTSLPAFPVFITSTGP